MREPGKALNLTQEQLAGRLSWSQERVSVPQNGKYGMPSLPLIAELAVAFNLPLSTILQVVGFQMGELVSNAEQLRQPGETRAGMELALSYTHQRLLSIQALTFKDAMNEASDLMAKAIGAEKVDVFLYELEIDSLVALETSHTDMGRKQHRVGLDRVPIAVARVLRPGFGNCCSARVPVAVVTTAVMVRAVVIVVADIESKRRTKRSL